jgi:uncharacterized protein YfdQ (DUF2303 family)
MEIENTQAFIEASRAGAAPTELAQVGSKTWWLVPGVNGRGSTVEVVDTEDANALPDRKRGTVTVFDAASFNQILADNADAGNIAIYFDRNPEKPAVVAVLNGNGRAGAGWGDFRVQISFRPTPQWLKWKAIDGKLMPQATFAEFVEDNLEDISDPAGGAMLEIVSYLQATRTVNFKSGLRLSNGQIQFQNMEDIQAQVGTGSIAVPETFTLGIAPIFGLTSYAVPARFRFRIQEGKLQMGFKLQRVETMMSRIVEDVIAKIERGANISVMDGLPPDATR